MQSSFLVLAAASAFASVASAQSDKDSQDTGATVYFHGDNFETDGAGIDTALEAKNSNVDWYLNNYNFGTSFTEARQIFAYYPADSVGSDSTTCVGIIGGIAKGQSGSVPNGKNGGCDAIWGNSCSSQIIHILEEGSCNSTMFSGIDQDCGTLTVSFMEVDANSFTPAQPAVWLQWDYSVNDTSEVDHARDLTFPVFAQNGDSANLACLRVAGAGAFLKASFGFTAFAALTASYLLI